MRPAVIAHISDLHFGRAQNPVASAALLQDLVENTQPDFVIATGDLSHTGSKSELLSAKSFLASIKTHMQAKGKNSSYIVIPGNHDLGLIKSHDNWDSTFLAENSEHQASSPSTLYDYFLEQGKSEPEAKELSSQALRVVEYYPGHDLVFLKFDSNMTSPWWPPDIARGNVGLDQIGNAQRVLNIYKEAFPGCKRSHRIALVHHHVQYLPGTESDALLLMKDAGDFWLAMLKMDIELILHGHKHCSAQMALRYYDKGQEKEVAILAGGSVSSTSQPPGQVCSYYLIACEPLRYTITKRVLAGGSFEEDGLPKIKVYHIPTFKVPYAKRAIDNKALSLILGAADDEIDLYHEYDSIECEARIDSTLNYHGKYIFTGRNVAASSSQGLIIPLVVVGAPKIADLALSLVDDRTGKAIPYHVDTALINKLRVCAEFRNVLPQRGEFKFTFRFSLPNVMYSDNDYDAFSLLRFRRGVRNFVYTFRTPWKVVSPRLYSIYRNGLDGDLGEMEDHSTASESVLRSPSISNSKALGILFFYNQLI